LKTLFLTIATLILSGCASGTYFISEKAKNSFDVQVNTINVDNLALEVSVGKGHVWAGWIDALFTTNKQQKWNGALVTPSLNDAITGKLKNSLNPIGTSGDVVLSVMRSGFFMEKHIADGIAFVNVLTLNIDRGFKCDVDVNVRIKNSSYRKTFEYGIKRKQFDDIDQVMEFIEICQSELVKQIATDLKINN
jgi:hypothetical protein